PASPPKRQPVAVFACRPPSIHRPAAARQEHRLNLNQGGTPCSVPRALRPQESTLGITTASSRFPPSCRAAYAQHALEFRLGLQAASAEQPPCPFAFSASSNAQHAAPASTAGPP